MIPSTLNTHNILNSIRRHTSTWRLDKALLLQEVKILFGATSRPSLALISRSFNPFRLPDEFSSLWH
jgi:hypothetical protein